MCSGPGYSWLELINIIHSPAGRRRNKTDSNSVVSCFVFQSRELDVAAVLARYDGQVEKNMKCKVQARKDNEYLKELRRVRRQQYKDKHRDEHRDRDRLMEETTNDEDISIEIDESRAADPEIPPQLLIKVGKKVRLAAEGEGEVPVKAVIEVERDHHHHKHGHVRQH